MPGAPTTSSRCIASWMVRMPVVCQEFTTLGLVVLFPIQKNLRVSNSTLPPPSAWCADMFCMMA